MRDLDDQTFGPLGVGGSQVTVGPPLPAALKTHIDSLLFPRSPCLMVCDVCTSFQRVSRVFHE